MDRWAPVLRTSVRGEDRAQAARRTAARFGCVSDLEIARVTNRGGRVTTDEEVSVNEDERWAEVKREAEARGWRRQDANHFLPPLWVSQDDIRVTFGWRGWSAVSDADIANGGTEGASFSEEVDALAYALGLMPAPVEDDEDDPPGLSQATMMALAGGTSTAKADPVPSWVERVCTGGGTGGAVETARLRGMLAEVFANTNRGTALMDDDLAGRIRAAVGEAEPEPVEPFEPGDRVAVRAKAGGPLTFGPYTVVREERSGVWSLRDDYEERLMGSTTASAFLMAYLDDETAWQIRDAQARVEVAITLNAPWPVPRSARKVVVTTRADVAAALTRADTDRFVAAMSAIARAPSPAEQRAAVVELVCAVLGVSDAG